MLAAVVCLPHIKWISSPICMYDENLINVAWYMTRYYERIRRDRNQLGRTLSISLRLDCTIWNCCDQTRENKHGLEMHNLEDVELFLRDDLCDLDLWRSLAGQIDHPEFKLICIPTSVRLRRDINFKKKSFYANFGNGKCFKFGYGAAIEDCLKRSHNTVPFSSSITWFV